MSTTNPRTIPELSEYEKNRMLIPEEEWKRYDQKWVAMSLDGKKIIAGAPDLAELDRVLDAMGESVENVGLEFVSFDDDLIGGQAEIV